MRRSIIYGEKLQKKSPRVHPDKTCADCGQTFSKSAFYRHRCSAGSHLDGKYGEISPPSSEDETPPDDSGDLSPPSSPVAKKRRIQDDREHKNTNFQLFEENNKSGAHSRNPNDMRNINAEDLDPDEDAILNIPHSDMDDESEEELSEDDPRDAEEEVDPDEDQDGYRQPDMCAGLSIFSIIYILYTLRYLQYLSL